MAHKALLIILDGWGIGKHDHANAIYNTPHPYYDYLVKTYPRLQAKTSAFPTDRWATLKSDTSI